MRRVAAVDCGTNSLKLLVTDLDADSGVQHDVLRTLRIVRLGQGVDRTGQLAPDAVDRTLQAAADYACLLYTSPSPRDRTRSRMPSSA